MKFFLILTFYLIINSSYSQSDYVWDKYSDPLLITSDNANSIDSFENNPESIVIFFYASVGTEHVAHPKGEARILVVESAGSV